MDHIDDIKRIDSRIRKLRGKKQKLLSRNRKKVGSRDGSVAKIGLSR